MKILKASEVRKLDELTIEKGIASGFILMERAGIGASVEIKDYICHFCPSVRKIIVLAGKGNNGGDGFVVAKRLSEDGFLVSIFIAAEEKDLKADALEHFKLIDREKVRCEFRKNISLDDIGNDVLIVDALLGTGLKGNPEGIIADWIKLINQSRRPVVSLDVPSGLDADEGRAYEPCVCADMTVTFGALKKGLFFNDALKFSGILRFVDIGFTRENFDLFEPKFECLTRLEAKKLLPRIENNSHKYSRGTACVIGGSAKYSGAPALAASAALNSGAGFVFMLVPECCENRNLENAIVRIALPVKLGDSLDSLSMDDPFAEIVNRSDAICFGPGISRSERIFPMLEYLWSVEKTVVFDADALYFIGYTREKKRKSIGILTPHEGEAKFLAEAYGIKKGVDRLELSAKIAERSGCVVVLKGCRTIVASPEGKISLNMSGSKMLASAGTGDVLAGLITSFCAQGLAPFDAARLGVFVHGLAGEKPAGKFITADRLIGLISEEIFRL